MRRTRMQTVDPSSATAASPSAPPSRQTGYRARLAATESDVRAAQRLRFEVFNMELDEGLPQSYDTGLDADPFEAVCDHLIVMRRLDPARRLATIAQQGGGADEVRAVARLLASFHATADRSPDHPHGVGIDALADYSTDIVGTKYVGWHLY